MKKELLHFLTGIALVCSCSLQAQVVGGGPANQGDYPWMTALLFDGNMGCGASLIDSQWVMTANHCVTEFFPGSGTVDEVIINALEHANPGPGSERIAVDTIINHPDFDLFSGGSDIALIRLMEPSAIAPLGRALSGDTSLYDATGSPSRVLGWGSTDVNGTQSPYLKEADVVVFAMDTCMELYQGNSQAQAALNNGERVICAGYFAGTDSAGAGSGDSGGPLIFNKNGEWIQIGVVSGGGGQVTTADGPGIFAEVAQYDQWIDETIAAVEAIRDTADTNTVTVGLHTPLEAQHWNTYFTGDRLQMEYSGTRSMDNQVSVYNSVGALVLRQPLLTANVQSLAAGHLSRGLYIVHVENREAGTVLTRKLIK